MMARRTLQILNAAVRSEELCYDLAFLLTAVRRPYKLEPQLALKGVVRLADPDLRPSHGNSEVIPGDLTAITSCLPTNRKLSPL